MSDWPGTHGFREDSPPVTMSRKLATQLLERMEMARDHIEHATGKPDEWARRIIAELTGLLGP